MNSYQAARFIESVVEDRLHETAQARVDVRNIGLAFDGDSATEIYKAALTHLGVQRREMAGWTVGDLRQTLRVITRTGAQRLLGRRGMAMDNGPARPEIRQLLGQAPAPTNLTMKNDIRR